MTLTLRSDVLHEVSHFDTPLQVLPPGEPIVEREHAVTKSNEPAQLTYEIYESEVIGSISSYCQSASHSILFSFLSSSLILIIIDISLFLLLALVLLCLLLSSLSDGIPTDRRSDEPLPRHGLLYARKQTSSKLSRRLLCAMERLFGGDSYDHWQTANRRYL